MFKVGDEIIWPVGDKPGRIIAKGVKYVTYEDCFVALVPKLHRHNSSSYDGIVYIRPEGTTIDGNPVRKAPVFRYRNVYKATTVHNAWHSDFRHIKAACSLAHGYLRAKYDENTDTYSNIQFFTYEEEK